jgi:hypothetical protein
VTAPPPLYPLEETRRARALDLLDRCVPGNSGQVVRQALAANLLDLEKDHSPMPLFSGHPGVNGPVTAEYLAHVGLIPAPNHGYTGTEVQSEMWRLIQEVVHLFLENPRSALTDPPAPLRNLDPVRTLAATLAAMYPALPGTHPAGRDDANTHAVTFIATAETIEKYLREGRP